MEHPPPKVKYHTENVMIPTFSSSLAVKEVLMRNFPVPPSDEKVGIGFQDSAQSNMEDTPSLVLPRHVMALTLRRCKGHPLVNHSTVSPPGSPPEKPQSPERIAVYVNTPGDTKMKNSVFMS